MKKISVKLSETLIPADLPLLIVHGSIGWQKKMGHLNILS